MLLLGFNKLSKLSEKLEEYIKKVEEETGCPARIKNVQDVGLPGADSVFLLHPKYIRVEIIEEKYLDPKGEIKQEEIECIIAHEVTHGLLAYKKNYCRYNTLILNNSEEEGKSADVLFTMIEDIVVNKIIDENNFFQPLFKNYINILTKREIEPLRDRKDCYEVKQHSLIFRDRFMVWRYIQAWGFLEYFDFDKDSERSICEYLELFKKSYPQQYGQAIKTKEIIRKNKIPTSEGFCKAIKKCLDLDFWNIPHIEIITTLKELQLLQTYNKGNI